MNKPTLFLDTTIQIERVVSPTQRRSQLQETLIPYRLITSTYVLGEFLRTLVKDAIQLQQRIAQYTHLDEVITDLGQHPNKRQASRMILILGTLLRSNRTAQSTFDTQTRLQVQDRLARYIEFGLLDHFHAGIDEIINGTQCGLARERPLAVLSADGHSFVYQLRSQCVRRVRECALAEQLQSWRPELAALANGLADEHDPVLLRMGTLAQQISEDPVLARGRNCTWYLGDLVIALELPADVPLYTTNLRHFGPLLTILGKKLSTFSMKDKSALVNNQGTHPMPTANPTTPPVRMAIAGMSHGHVNWILRTLQRDNLEIVGFWEPNRALAERYAAQYGFGLELVYADLAAMLDATKPEAVCAFGSIYEHLQVVAACAPRQIHVMVEKPLAVNLDHAEQMATLARTHHIHLLTNFETTWYASTYEAYRLAVAEATLGPIRKVVVHDGHFGPQEIGCNAEFLAWLTDPLLNGGGAVVDFGCYGANLITWLMGGAEPLTVTAVLQTLKPDIYPHVDDEATIILTYPGAQGIIQGSWNWPVGRKDLEIYGTHGYLVAVDALNLRQRQRGEAAETTHTLPPAPAQIRDPFNYLAAVVRGAERVTPGNLWSLENALSTVRILDAARRSASEGRTVQMTPAGALPSR